MKEQSTFKQYVYVLIDFRLIGKDQEDEQKEEEERKREKEE